MLNKFLSTVKKYNMFNNRDRVLACVSGGADSVAMLLLLNDAKADLGIEITVVHVNHLIRGKEADRDEQFVINLSKALNLPCITKHINIPEIAKIKQQSIELVARDERYKYFYSLNYDKICTAHTKSDCVETFIMNFSRGCGLNGLTSIPPVRNKVVRPLIDFFRFETEKCCKLHNCEFVTDSTNLIDDCTRNKIRLNIIPSLNEIFNGFENNTARCISSISEDENCLNSIANIQFNNSYNINDNCLYVKDLTNCHIAILSRVVILFLETFQNCSPEKKHIDYICQNIKYKFSLSLPGGIDVIGDGEKLFQRHEHINSQFNLRLSKYDINNFDYNGIHFSCFPSDICDDTIDETDLKINFESIDTYFNVRTRLPGDVIKLKKRNCTKSLKKLYNELKLSQKERDSTLLFEDSNGIFALSGFSNNINSSTQSNEQYLIIKFRRL